MPAAAETVTTAAATHRPCLGDGAAQRQEQNRPGRNNEIPYHEHRS
jgi:hypothetical protein